MALIGSVECNGTVDGVIACVVLYSTEGCYVLANDYCVLCDINFKYMYLIWPYQMR